ncbi:MAG: glycosyltransferase [Eubacteriales bacterium]|nr:glycosyltransferase [Eubacteriales bacterium]
MKITLFIGGLYGGGAERVMCNFANFLVGENHDVEMLPMSDDEKTYPLDSRVKVCPLIRNNERKNKIIDAIIRLYRLNEYMKRRTDRDAYVVMLPITTIMMLMLRGSTKAKIIASERVDPNCYPKMQKILLKKLAKRADGYVFQTEEIRNWYGDKVTDDKASIIPNAINPDFIRPAYSGERKKNIVSVGRLNRQKNFTMLISAFAKVSKDFPEHTLTIYGKGAQKESLIKHATELGIVDKVLFPGQVSNIAEVIQDSQMFVLSSDYEGMPNALMEAMALGLPCVSTDCGGGGARALINDGVNGILVPIGDTEALTNGIKRVLEDKEFAEKISKNASEIQQKLAPQVIYGRWERFIQDIFDFGIER